jgi:hypothetical protein
MFKLHNICNKKKITDYQDQIKESLSQPIIDYASRLLIYLEPQNAQLHFAKQCCSFMCVKKNKQTRVCYTELCLQSMPIL